MYHKVLKLGHGFRDLSRLSTYNIEKENCMFEDLIDQVNKIEKNLSLLVDLHMQQTNSLTTYNEVARFLGTSTRTIRNYMKDLKLVANTHYYLDAKGKTVFIPKAIMEFKHGGVSPKSIEKRDTTASRVMHPIASRILKGVA
jgi:hypothetical protein